MNRELDGHRKTGSDRKIVFWSLVVCSWHFFPDDVKKKGLHNIAMTFLQRQPGPPGKEGMKRHNQNISDPDNSKSKQYRASKVALANL